MSERHAQELDRLMALADRLAGELESATASVVSLSGRRDELEARCAQMERDHAETVAEVERLRAALKDACEQLCEQESDTAHWSVEAAKHKADRDRARDAAVALEQQLAEIERLAYIGGQDDSSVRRWILGVFERERRTLDGGEQP